jgi:hypothetical protein
MVLPADMGTGVSISAVHDTLTQLEVEETTIKQIVDILEQAAGGLEKAEPGTVKASYLGGSTSGSVLAHHTEIAHRHVVEAMAQMVLGLRGYQANVQKFHQDIDFVDEDSGASSTRTTGKVNGVVPSVSAASDCAAPIPVDPEKPDFSTNEQCTIPGGN